MNFSLSEEQREMHKATIAFAKRELAGNVRAREEKREFHWEGWRKCAEFGIHGLPMPEEYGGMGLDLLTCVVAMEALGYACEDHGLLFAINSNIWTCEFPILKFGSDEQKQRYLPGLINGSLVGGHAMTEPNAGSDAFGIKCRAERMGDQYLLNGTKMFITNAPIADLLLVFAVTDPQKDYAGISAFIVERNTPGFAVGKSEDLMGLKTCPIGEVILKDCIIPESCRLGKEGAGAGIFNAEMELERSCLFATHLGAMERQLEQCIAYANERTQFGRKIGDNQAISNKIALMKVRTELSRLILHKVAWMKSEGQRAPIESAISKFYTSESYVQNSLASLHIHGAYGYSTEFGFERQVRDSIAGRIYSGTSEIQLNFISKFLGI